MVTAARVSKYGRSAIRALENASRSFDHRFLPRRFVLDGNSDFIQRLSRDYLFPGATVIDIGGGKNPVISLPLKQQLGLRVAGLDISESELGRAPAGVYDTVICADVTQYRGTSSADVALCAALIEHVTDTSSALRAIFTTIKPGGVALLFVPCRNALYARINLMLPAKLKRWLLHIIYGHHPEVKANLTGFPAYYDRCTPRDFQEMGNSIGFIVELLQVYFACGYFQFMPPLHVAWRLWQLVCRSAIGDQAAESFSIVFRKSLN